jgi:hypothetical protein
MQGYVPLNEDIRQRHNQETLHRLTVKFYKVNLNSHFVCHS